MCVYSQIDQLLNKIKILFKIGEGKTGFLREKPPSVR